jgi:hypothetical protein
MTDDTRLLAQNATATAFLGAEATETTPGGPKRLQQPATAERGPDTEQLLGDTRTSWVELVALRPGLTAGQYAHLAHVPLARAAGGLRRAARLGVLRRERCEAGWRFWVAEGAA